MSELTATVKVEVLEQEIRRLQVELEQTRTRENSYRDLLEAELLRAHGSRLALEATRSALQQYLYAGHKAARRDASTVAKEAVAKADVALAGDVEPVPLRAPIPLFNVAPDWVHRCGQIGRALDASVGHCPRCGTERPPAP